MNITATNCSSALLLGIALISISFATAFNGLGSSSSISLSPIRSQKLIVRLVDSPFDEISSQVPTTPLYMSKSTEEGVPSTPLDRPVLAAVDTLAILVFAAIGKASHAPDGSIDFLSVGMTAFPFLLSWFVTSPLLGCYKPDATSDIKSAVVQTGKGWFVAVPLGCALRGIIKGYVPPAPFVIVTLIATLVILSIGRAAYTALSELYVEMF